MTAEMSEHKIFKCRHFLMMLLKEFIRRRINAEIAHDALTLYVSGIAVEFDDRMLKVADSYAVATERLAFRELPLQNIQIPGIQNKGLKLVPLPFQKHLYPGMKYFLRRACIYDTRHSPLLQFLINHKPVYAAGNSAAAEQSHKESPLGIALSETIRKNTRCGDVVAGIITEKYFIPDKIIDRLDSPEFGLVPPMSGLHQSLNRWRAIIQHRSGTKIIICIVYGSKIRHIN